MPEAYPLAFPANQARPLSDQVVVSKNLLLQTLAYLEQHPDSMAKMLLEQMRYALQEQDRDEQL